MKLAGNHESGTLTVERVASRNKNREELKRENRTELLGPFSREEIHARVGGTVSATLSRNYHAISIAVTVNIPVHATEEGVDVGLAWAFKKANTVMNEELKGANRALDKLAARNR